MHNKEKYPEIWAAKERAEAALAPLLSARDKEMAKVNKCGEEIGALREKKEAAHNKACENWDEIARLRKEISRLAKAMGAESA